MVFIQLVHGINMASEKYILGSRMKFDLRSVPFSSHGAFLCIFESQDDRSLYLSISRSPERTNERRKLIKLTPVLDGNELPYEYTVSPGTLTITTWTGVIDICFASEKQLRIRGNGIGLRLSFQTRMFENLSPKEDGSMEMAYVMLGKLLFVPLKGAMWHGAKWIPQKAMVEDFDMVLLPSVETREFEIAIHEYFSNGKKDNEYNSFVDCAA